LIVAETSAGRLTAFDITRDGTLRNRRTAAEFTGFHFDGICLDDHGDVWIGGGLGGLLRVAGEGRAATLHQFEVPQRMVLDCVFGGETGRELFLATTGQQLIENLRYVGADRSRDRDVDSDGLVLRMSSRGER
jgi:sugar lactone lactonase YvrE